MTSLAAPTKWFACRFIAFSLLALATPVACSLDDVDEIFGPVPDAQGAPAGTAISFQTFTDDAGGRAASETRALIRSQKGYQDFFGHSAPADIDFSREWVIFYGAGSQLTGGFEASVLSLTRSGSALLAVTRLVSPGTGCTVSQGLTSPHVFIRFAAQWGGIASFAKSDVARTCDPTNVCAAVLCMAGTHCEAQQVQCVRAPCPPVAVCVPNTTPARCGGIAGIPCPAGLTCVDDPTDSCDPAAGGADCGGICVQPTSACAAVLCMVGTHCEEQPVQCVRAPCPPVAVCVPNPTPTTCGGIAGRPCPTGQVCVDDPADSCDPKAGGADCGGICVAAPPPPPVQHCGGFAGTACPGAGKCVDDPSDDCDPMRGGADCGGICQCVQNVLCTRDHVFDSSPQVCACVKGPNTCGPVCAIFCQYGNVLDAAGCPTCACKPAP